MPLDDVKLNFKKQAFSCTLDKVGFAGRLEAITVLYTGNVNHKIKLILRLQHMLYLV